MRKKKKHNKVVLLARSKLNSLENIISKALRDVDNSHEQFTIIVNEVDKYHKLNKKQRSMKLLNWMKELISV